MPLGLVHEIFVSGPDVISCTSIHNNNLIFFKNLKNYKVIDGGINQILSNSIKHPAIIL